jgi:outer membrane cobalamin receptor
MRKLVIILFLNTATFCLHAQVFNISGTVTDASTGEHLISANVYNAKTYDGTVTNNYGYYSLKQKAGKIEITYSYLGYKLHSQEIDLNKDTRIDIALEPSLDIEEVVVTSNTPGDKVRSTQTSMVELPLKTIKNLPVLLGETDVIKGLQLMPGVQGGTEGTSGLYVRGGSTDQNLILLDGVPVYNVNHLFGIFSVFNGDALNSVTMYKGGFPARYGGRLSSVVDIRMKEGNKEKIRGNATVGLLASKLTVDGPINDKTTFLVSGRRTNFDALSYPIQKMAAVGSNQKTMVGYYFYDLNGKISHQLNENNRFYLSSYLGADDFSMKEEFKLQWDKGQTGLEKSDIGLKWGNITTSARWNHIFRSDLFSNLTLSYSKFNFKVYEDFSLDIKTENSTSKESYDFEYISKIQDFGVNYDFDYMLNNNHYIKFGASGTLHLFSPGVSATKQKVTQNSKTEASNTKTGTRDIPSIETHAYIEDDFKVGNKLQFNIGFHHSTFSTDKNFYQSFEPRFSARYLINDDLSFKMSYIAIKQYLMLLTSNSMSLPTDLWIPVDGDLKPQKSWQTAGGFTYSMNNKYLFSVEGFYKEMFNVTEYKEGIGIFNLQGDFTKALTQGYGESYGVELFARKNSGKTTGWVSYTLAWANRKFPQVGNGVPFPYKYDRRHQVNIIVEHKINDKWNLGTNWIYGSGYPFTLGENKFVNINELSDPEFSLTDLYEDSFTEAMGNRNNYRMPNYHRLDFNFNYTKVKKQRERTWSFGVYNTYFRQNPFIIRRGERDKVAPGESANILRQTSILVFVPYFRWSIDLDKKQ